MAKLRNSTAAKELHAREQERLTRQLAGVDVNRSYTEDQLRRAVSRLNLSPREQRRIVAAALALQRGAAKRDTRYRNANNEANGQDAVVVSGGLPGLGKGN